MILPAHITRRECVIPLTHTSGYNPKLQEDHLCLFRALAHARHAHDDLVDAHAVRYFLEYYGAKKRVRGYKGFDLLDLHLFEDKFDVNVNVFELKLVTDPETKAEVQVAETVRESVGKKSTTMNCNLYANHFSYITSISEYCRRYLCKKCTKFFKTPT